MHELVHAAEARLGVPYEKEKTQKEIVAQLGASTILHLIGRPVAADVGYTFDYIHAHVLEDNPEAGDLEVLEACTAVLERIHAAVAYILEEAQAEGLLDEELRLVQAEESPKAPELPASSSQGSGHPDAPYLDTGSGDQLSLF